MPACFHNLYGVKPSLGLLSTRGVVPACATLDTISLFTFTADDAAKVLSITSTYDDQCAWSRKHDFIVHGKRYGKAPAAFRFGIPLESQWQTDAAYTKGMHQAIAELEATSKKEFTKVKAFHIENFKGIENLSAMLDGKSCVFFSRQNGGKTCASQHAIQTLLQNFPGSKLRNGANEGKLVFELEHPNGPALVQIDFDKAGNENVTVWLNGSHKPENKKSGLDFLKSLHSPAHDFDIADIFRTRGQERAKAIIKMLGIDLTEEEKAYAVAFEDRKAVKRDLDSQAARIEVITPTQRELAAKPMVST